MFSSYSKWICAGNERVSPLICREFTLKHGVAKIRICGLGFFELFLNGKRVGDDLLVPVFSDYMPRPMDSLYYPLDDEMRHRIYVVEYDITEYLQKGSNTMGILLGDGWWRQTDKTGEGRLHFSLELCTRYEIFSGDQLVAFSDGSEVYTDSFIRKSNLFYGEVQDFGADISKQYPVRLREDFCDNYQLQTCPGDRVMAVHTPKRVYAKDASVYYDAGKNLSGRVRMISGGGNVIVRHAEKIDLNGLDYSTSGDWQIQQDEYYNTKPGDVLYPHFRWSGFRYFEIVGQVQELTVEEIYSNVAVTSAFHCSDDTVNFYYQASVNALLANMHCGVPSDCPHRERLGYTGDGQLACEMALLTTDSEAFYRKWLEDIYDCQDVKTGHVQHTAPFNGGGGGPGGWGGAIAIVPDALYRITGDKTVLAKALPNIHRFLDCMASFCEDGLVVREREGGLNLGDWCVPGYNVHIPGSYVNTYFYIRCMAIADFFAAELGQPAQYTEAIAYHKRRLVEEFYDSKHDCFCGSVEGADLYAIDLGIAPQSLIEKTARRYENKPYIETGIFGTELLLKFLSQPQHIDTFIRVLAGRDYPSFGFMQRKGATTLWETWEGQYSHNHPMFGAGVKYLFYGLLGIHLDAANRTVSITPAKQHLLSFVSGKLTLWGNEISVDCCYEGEKIHMTVVSQKENCVIVRHQGKVYPVDSGQSEYVFCR